MADVKHIFSGAPVRPDGYERGPEETGIFVFMMETATGPSWFEADFEFAENGNDFWVLISNFGLRDKSEAGNRTTDNLRKFSSREIESATDRIREYFSGPEEKDFLPFNHHKGSCLGVRFSRNWAAVK